MAMAAAPKVDLDGGNVGPNVVQAITSQPVNDNQGVSNAAFTHTAGAIAQGYQFAAPAAGQSYQVASPGVVQANNVVPVQQMAAPNAGNFVQVNAAAPFQQVMIVTQGPHPQNIRDWSTELCRDCACCENGSICCYGFVFSPCLYAQSAKRIGEHCCYGFFCPLALNVQFRAMYGIKGSGCDDACCVFWCGLCAGCRLAREMDIMGIPGPHFLCC